MRPLIGSEETRIRAALGGSSSQQEVEAMHHRFVLKRRPFREGLHSAARLIDPAPPITSLSLHLSLCSSCFCQAQWRMIFLRTSRPRRARPCVFFFFSPLRGVTCVAKRRSGVEQSCNKQLATPSTLCLVTSGVSFPGCKKVNPPYSFSSFFRKTCSIT